MGGFTTGQQPRLWPRLFLFWCPRTLHVAATALHFAHYNFVRRHQTLRISPAMAAGVSSTLWSMGELLEATLDGVRA